MKKITLLFAIWIFSTSFALATEGFDRGYSAYKNNDYDQAFKWFKKDAEQGNGYSQYYLGLMYYHGQSVPKNNIRAYVWSGIAGWNGYEPGTELSNIIVKELSENDQKEAAELNYKILMKMMDQF